MEKSNTVPMLVVGAFLVILFIIWQKRQAIVAAQSVAPSGYVAIANTVNGKVNGVLSKIPLVGGVLQSAITKPVSNVTSGNYGATVESAMTAGLSDVSSTLGHYASFGIF